MNSILYKCGCGCVVIPLIDPAKVEKREDFKYIKLEDCRYDSTTEWGPEQFRIEQGHVDFINIQKGEYLSEEALERYVDRINFLVHQGYRLNEIQNLLGVKRER